MAAAATESRLGHLPALDGLRAVAVIAVFLFHAGVIDGGFIGVDVFFVVSGFLITALAITEIERTGRIDLAAFWARRARRLLPAVFALCAVVVVASAALGGGAARRVGRDVIAALAYVANWTQVSDNRDYFAVYESPSLLEHTWSLAVEEQFYIVWPLVLAGLAALAGPRLLRRAVGGAAGAFAVGSVALAWWLAHRGVDLNRLYYGTDTRAVGLALGAIAACVLARGSLTGSRRVGRVESAVAVAGAAVLTVAAVVIDGRERWLYGPGFLLIAAASLAIVTAASGVGPVQRVLGRRPLVAVGRVSYGIYLWHWPVIVLLDHDRTGLRGPGLGLLWIGVTALLTVASWYLVEQPTLPPAMAHPVRTVGYVAVAVTVAFGANATVSAERAGRGDVAIPTAPLPVGPRIGADDDVIASATPLPTAAETVPSIPSMEPDAEAIDPAFVDARPDATPAASPATPPDAARSEQPGRADPAAVVTTTSPAIERPDRPLRVLIIGDSVAASLDPVPDGAIDVDGFGEVVVRNDGVVACPVLRVGTWKFEGLLIDDPAQCSGEDRFAAAVEEFRPDVLFVFFGWPARGEGRHLDDGTVISPCDRAFDGPWADELELLARRFESETRVVVANVAPPGLEFSWDAAGGRCLNTALEGRDLTVFDFAEWICPAGDCRRFDALRPDAVHFGAADEIRLPVLAALVGRALTAAGYAPLG